MKVLADLHHADLYFSLHLLFEERLGWELYRPIGLDWFHENYWRIAAPYGNAIDTVGQYLNINHDGYDQFKNLNGTHYIEDEVYYSLDPGHDYYQKAITFEKFKSTKFDLIVSTIASHDELYEKMRDLYQPQAKIMVQMGNIHQETTFKNVLYSVPYKVQPNQNACFYHQEIDRKLYKYIPPNPNTKNIFSMVNLLPSKEVYQQYKTALPEVNFKAYGAGCPDGTLPGTKGVASEMINANIGWHIKPHDGFGHTAMGWFASGRPVITRMTDVLWYGLDAPQLFEPGVTCIDVGSGTHQDVCKTIRNALEPEENQRLAQNAYNRFNQVVNYEEEFTNIKQFMERTLND